MKRIISVFVVFAAVLAASCVHAQDAPAAELLNMGSPAPAMKVFKWVKGNPVPKFLPGKIYVVEFWATWCPPCRESIPHLTELAKTYKGKVNFVGVCVWDSTDRATRKPQTEKEYVDKVAAFVKEQGDKMVYNVALDDLKGTMAQTWMTAARQNGIPSSFVIGKDGKIAAICHPMELDPILEEVVAGKFDVAAYKQKKDAERAEAERVQKLFAKVTELHSAKKYTEAVAEIDRIVAENPSLEEQIAYNKFSMMMQADDCAGAVAYGKKIADSIYKDNAQALYAIANTIAKNDKQKPADLDAAIAMAEKSVTLSNSEDYNALSILASAYYKKGNAEKAIECQEKAIKLAEALPNPQASLVASMKTKLEEYKAKK